LPDFPSQAARTPARKVPTSLGYRQGLLLTQYHRLPYQS
jgi:hypothetical protein